MKWQSGPVNAAQRGALTQGCKIMRPGYPISGPHEVDSSRAVPMQSEHVYARMEIECSVVLHVG